MAAGQSRGPGKGSSLDEQGNLAMLIRAVVPQQLSMWAIISLYLRLVHLTHFIHAHYTSVKKEKLGSSAGKPMCVSSSSLAIRLPHPSPKPQLSSHKEVPTG